MRSVFRNKKQPEKTGPKNKATKEMCKAAHQEVADYHRELAEALRKRVIKDGSPNAMAQLIRLAEMMKLGPDGEEEPEAEESNFHRNLLDQWESEPEWTGETDEEAAEVASINHELETWQSALAAEPECKETAAQHASQTGAAQNELGIRAAEPAGVVTSSGFVVYQGAAAKAPTETKAVDHSR